VEMLLEKGLKNIQGHKFLPSFSERWIGPSGL
jgi:hypothetical protein